VTWCRIQKLSVDSMFSIPMLEKRILHMLALQSTRCPLDGHTG
jgi:hypothetical protein